MSTASSSVKVFRASVRVLVLPVPALVVRFTVGPGRG